MCHILVGTGVLGFNQLAACSRVASIEAKDAHDLTRSRWLRILSEAGMSSGSRPSLESAPLVGQARRRVRRGGLPVWAW